MGKKISVLLLCLFTILCFCGYSQAHKADTFIITAGSGAIKVYTVSSNQNGPRAFKAAFARNTAAQINYVKLNTKLILSLGIAPDKLTVDDYLLNAKGAQRYTDRETVHVVLTKKGHGQYIFILKKHLASALSNVIQKDAKDYRGFLVTATMGKCKKTYAFVLKTDGFDT